MSEKKRNNTGKRQIVINQVPIEWNERQDRFTFFGIEAIIFWKDPSLLSILKPLREELGENLFSLLIAYEAAKGTYEDYYQMVAKLGGSFEEGFMSWGRAVSGAGWGRFDLQEIDWDACRARVLIQEPWELSLFSPSVQQNAVPFLNGKLSGIFSWAFDRHCRATVKEMRVSADSYVLLEIAPSAMTLEQELEKLKYNMELNRLEHLQVTNRTLREQLERYLDVIEATGEFIWEMDRWMQIIFVSRIFTDTLGYEPEEIDGLDFRELLTDDSRALISSWLEKEAGRKSGAVEMELAAYSRKGDICYLSVGIMPIIDMRGLPIGYRCAGRDITSKKRAQEELRESEECFRQIAENVEEGFYVMVSDCSKILYANSACGKIFDIGLGDLYENPGVWLEKVLPEDLENLKESMGKKEDSSSGRKQEFRLVHSSGEVRWLTSHFYPVRDDQGDTIRWAVIVRDITERKKAESEKDQVQANLLHLQKMESIGQLAAGIAHEINTPTQYISSNLDFLAEVFEDVKGLVEKYEALRSKVINKEDVKDIATDLEEFRTDIDWDFLTVEIPRALEQSRDGAGRVSSIVRSMKEFSHPGGKEKKPEDFNKIIENTVTVSRNEWKYVAELTLDLDRDLPAVSCLRDEMGQVFLNMVTNAAQALKEKLGDNPEGGKGLIAVESRLQGDEVEIRIADNGRGMGKEVRERIFDPFFTTKTVGQGTGQGLSICHDVIVNKHQGTLACESKPGQGTVFIIRLPLE